MSTSLTIVWDEADQAQQDKHVGNPLVVAKVFLITVFFFLA